MNWEQVQGNWEQLKGKVKQTWGKLTDDDLTVIKGRENQLAGKLREKYGYAKERAQEEINRFLKDCECDSDSDLDSRDIKRDQNRRQH